MNIMVCHGRTGMTLKYSSAEVAIIISSVRDYIDLLKKRMCLFPG